MDNRQQVQNDYAREARDHADWLARFPEENPNPIAQVAADGRVLYCNPASREFPGWGCETGKLLNDDLLPLVRVAITEDRKLQQDLLLGDRYYSISVIPFRAGEYANLYGMDITDRQQAEEALRRSEAVLAQAGQMAHLGAWEIKFNNETDLDENPLRWSDEVYRIFGYQPGEVEVTNDLFFERVHPDDRERIREAVTQALTEKRSYQVEHRIIRPDGEVRIVLEHAEIRFDDQGRPLQMVGAVQDLTEQKQAEAALRASEERFRHLADAMPQLVWTARPDGSVDYYNRRHEEYQGILNTTKAGWQWSPVLHPDDLQPTLAAWENAVRNGEIYQIEHRVMTKNGFRWHLSRGIPSYDQQGNITKWYGTATDIHDFKMAQEALRLSELRMRRLVEANIIGIVSRDADGRILDANDAFLTIAGYSREDIQNGRLTIEAITPEEYHPRDQRCREDLDLVESCQPYEKEYIRKDGSRIPVLIGYTTVKDVETEYIGFVIDLSELKRAQAELADYAEKLKQSNQELERFAFIASHDLQEPVRKMKIFGDRIHQKLKDSLDEETEEMFRRMENAADRMQAMIGDLLELSRINSRGRPFVLVDLNQAAEDVRSDLEATIQRTGGELLISPLPAIQADPVQIRQLLQNLISNGLKFHKPGTPPVVRVYGEVVPTQAGKPDLLSLTIEDNGIGFEEQYQETIFQPFQRLQGRNSAYEGSGIGLSICQKIVDRHHGTIQAYSKPGEGSKFVVLLPVDQQG